MTDSIEKPTAGAVRAFGLAQIVNKVFAADRVASTVPGHPGYRVAMSAPEGPSTSERKGAVDHLRLVPAGATIAKGGSAAPILIGKADPNLSQLELRTFERLKAHHAEEFGGEALPIDRATYDALRTKLEEFFDRQGIATVALESHGTFSNPPRVSSAPRSKLPVLVVVALAIVAAVAFFALRK